MGGSFIGHIIPGTLFTMYGLYWCLYQWRRYFVMYFKLGKDHLADAQYPCSRYTIWGRIPWEGAIKVLVCLLGVCYEVFVGGWEGKYFGVANVQHMGAYSLYGSSGVVDLLLHFKCPIPKQSDTIVILFALMQECVGLGFHLHGRYEIDKMLHTLLLFVIVFASFMVGMELRFPDSPLVSLGRAFGVGLQGTWMIQLASMLYPPVKWMRRWVPGNPNAYLYDEMNRGLRKLYSGATTNATIEAYGKLREKQFLHQDIMFVVTIFGFHMYMVLLTMFLIGLFVHLYYKRIAASNAEYHRLGEELMND